MGLVLLICYRCEISQSEIKIKDIVVYNSPEDYLNGHDTQLERAVKEMLKEGAAFKEKTKNDFGGHKK